MKNSDPVVQEIQFALGVIFEDVAYGKVRAASLYVADVLRNGGFVNSNSDSRNG